MCLCFVSGGFKQVHLASLMELAAVLRRKLLHNLIKASCSEVNSDLHFKCQHFITGVVLQPPINELSCQLPETGSKGCSGNWPHDGAPSVTHRELPTLTNV